MLVLTCEECGAGVAERISAALQQGAPVQVQVKGVIPLDSEYARCLERGSLRMLDDEGHVHVRGRRILNISTHTWVPGGLLSLSD